MGWSVAHTHTAPPAREIACSLSNRAFGAMKALTTCKGTGFSPMSSNSAFGNAPLVAAS
jgi:hypothetical protein